MRRRTIHTQMVVRIVITVTIALSFIFALSYDAIRSIIQDQINQSLLSQAQMAAHEVDAAIRQQKTMVETFARVINGIYNSDDPLGNINHATRMFAEQPNPLVFGYWFTAQSDYKQQGKFTSRYGYNENHQLLSYYSPSHTDDSLPIFRDNPMFDYYHGAVKTGATYITSPYLDPHLRIPMLSLSTPVYDKQLKVRGVAGIDIRFNDLHTLSTRLSFYPNSETLLISQQDEVLYNPDSKINLHDINYPFDTDISNLVHEIKQNKTQMVNARYKDKDVIIFAMPITEPGWTALIMLPTSVIDQVLARVLLISLITFAILVITVYILVHLWVKRLITKPLKVLVQASQRIAIGDFSGTVHIQTENEWMQLEKHMNQMLETLRHHAKLEQEMKRMSALKVVGEMAAAISHEIRNPLTTVRGFLQLLRNKPEHAAEHVYFDTMMDEIIRANTIITEYLTLAQNKLAHFTPQSLNHIIEQIYPLVQASATANCQHIVMDLQTLPAVMLDEKEIRQLLHNVIRNGLEAMEANKVLQIRTRAGDEAVLLEIEDEGPGFEPSILSIAGTPFMTTKVNGTGLGLAICYSIVQRHHGSLHISSKPGRTVISIKLPLVFPAPGTNN
ncbi:sensor histidine kinase [Paenibacillus sp. UMB4589-SE434]|uniref:sensor histidine kinase n=1 Tax=Paenibacillus sp. UMB4589-SE434 TaxID=3046314 RepID=UPI00254C5EA8|nr:sensor histidine kinase [Paenibacillus sp. UMB4589-SE434]MDK8179983.1 sensor histidine kinase [Paenibacillus sp. UMB4589-SE434]